MIIVWGSHDYGRIDAHDGEYAETRFGHVYWLPLFPIESRWITRVRGSERIGFVIKLSGRSVVATYLRCWAPLIALGLGATLTIWGLAAAAGLLALSGWSWTWRRLRGARALRRAQLDQVAFGTSCDPLRRPTGWCVGKRNEIAASFAEVSSGRTPEDVARLGAESPMQAALAYASLRLLAATSSGTTARKAKAASERIVDGLTDRDAGALADGGPYRARQGAEATPGELEEAAAAAMRHVHGAIDEQVAARQWANSPDNPAVKAEIARNKAARAGRNKLAWVALALLVPAFVGAFAWKFYQERRDATRALAELERITDETCACETPACLDDVAARHFGRLEALERAVNDGGGADKQKLEDLAWRVKGCVRAVERDR